MRTTFASWPACDGPAAIRAPIGILGAPHATPYRRGEPGKASPDHVDDGHRSQSSP